MCAFINSKNKLCVSLLLLPIYIESRENLSLLNDENIRQIQKISKTLMSSSNIWRIQINLLVFTKFTFPVLWRRLFLLWRLVVICACVKTITSFVRHPSSNRNFSGLSEKKFPRCYDCLPQEVIRIFQSAKYTQMLQRPRNGHGEENCQHRWFRKLVREAERHSFVCITFSFKMTLCFEYSSIFDSLHSRKQKYCQNFLRQLFLECT